MQGLHAATHRKTSQITISPFLDHESEVEHHHLLQEAEQILLHTPDSKWHLHKHHRDHKLILKQVPFLARLAVMLMHQHCP